MSISPEIKAIIKRLERERLELLKLATDSERKLMALCDSMAKVDEKWWIRLESWRKIEESVKNDKIS